MGSEVTQIDDYEQFTRQLFESGVRGQFDKSRKYGL